MAQRIFRPPARFGGASSVALRDEPRWARFASASGSIDEEPSFRGLRIRRLRALRRVIDAPAVPIGLEERRTVSSGGAGGPGKSEEPRSGPGRARDLPGDAGQRSIEFPLELETLFGDDHRVGSSMPFSDKASPRFDPRLSPGCDPPIALELGGETRQPPQGRLRQAAESDLLNAIRERPHYEIATQVRRFGAIEPPPFLTHRAELESLESGEPIRDVTAWRTVARRRRSQHTMARQ